MDIGTLVGTSGPLAALAAIAGFLLKAYLEKRKVDRESESGIVETTSATLRIVRGEMAEKFAEAQTLRSQVAELERRIRTKDTEIQALRSQVAGLESQLRFRSSPPDVAQGPPGSGLSQ